MFNLGQFINCFVNASHKNKINKDVTNKLLESVGINLFLEDYDITRLIKSEKDINYTIENAKINTAGCISKIVQLIESYIVPERRAHLVADIICHIINDSTIKDDDTIDVVDKLIKSNLIHTKEYSLYNFVAGVFLFVINRPTKWQNNQYTTSNPTEINNIIRNITLKENTIDDKSVPLSIDKGTFFGVFKNVNHLEKLNIRRSSQLKFYHLDLDSTDFDRFDYNKLKTQIYLNLDKYAFSRPEIKNLIDKGLERALINQAIKRIQQCDNLCLEDFLLYIMLEFFLKAPKLLTSIEIQMHKGFHQPASSSIHLLNKLSKTEDQYQLIFGVSSMSNNLYKMIDDIFLKIQNILKNDIEKNQFISHNVINSTFSEQEAKFIIDVYKNGINQHSIKGIGLFIGYKLDIEGNYTSKKEFETLFKQKLDDDIKFMTNIINKKIENLNLFNYPMYIYIVPFNNPDEDKQKILDDILKGEIL